MGDEGDWGFCVCFLLLSVRVLALERKGRGEMGIFFDAVGECLASGVRLWRGRRWGRLWG